MTLLKELNNLPFDLITEETKKNVVPSTTAAIVYHRDYERTKKRKYRKYHPSEGTK
jgi:hypothetical protein